MAQSVVTLTAMSPPKSSFDAKTIDYYFTVGIAAGDYPPGGFLFSFGGYVAAPGAPLEVRTFSSASPVSGYSYRYNQNAKNNAVITNLALTTNVVTVTANNNFVTGQSVVLSGLTTSTFLNGQTVTVITTGLSATAFRFNFTHANVSTGAETGVAKGGQAAGQTSGGLQVFSGATEQATGATPAAVVADVITMIVKMRRG